MLKKIATLATSLVIFCLIFNAYAEEQHQINAQDFSYIVRTFLRNHYPRGQLTEEKGQQVVMNYINALDPGHFYFLEDDIAAISNELSDIHKLIYSGNLELALQIYDKFKQRVEERHALIKELLGQDFDFETDDQFVIDRKELGFAKSSNEINQLWNKKLKFELFEMLLDDISLDEAKQRLIRRYEAVSMRLQQQTHNDIASDFINSVTTSFDPHSTYFSPEDLENFNIGMRLSLEGIGATLRWEDGYTVVTSLTPGGAAQREGNLKKEDKIVAVAQGEDGEFQDIFNMRLEDVVGLIRGKRGTVVRLKILRRSDNRDETPYAFKIVRDKILLTEGEAKQEIKEIVRDGITYRIGVITLPSFYMDMVRNNDDGENFKSSARDVLMLLQELSQEDVSGIVLDLRDNGGGSLEEAVAISGMLTGDVPIVQIKNIMNHISILTSPSQRVYSGPLVVIINRYSASASEILAGALKDYERAIIIGDKSTYGKGTVQNVMQLNNDLGALKITIAQFYRPSSSSTQNKGVEPHIVLPSINNHIDVGEASLPNALAWDSTPPLEIDYNPTELPRILPQILERSQERISQSEYFEAVQERVDRWVAEEKDASSITIQSMRNSQAELNKTEQDSYDGDAYLEEGLEIVADWAELEQELLAY